MPAQATTSLRHGALVHDKAKVEIGEDVPDGVEFTSPGWFERIVATRESELSSGKMTAADVAELRRHQNEIVETMSQSIRDTQAQRFMAGVADDALAKWIMDDQVLEIAKKPKPQHAAAWKAFVRKALTFWLDPA
jgi:hypothetical protein